MSHLFSQNEYMKDNFMIKIETWHKPDMGEQDNVSINSINHLQYMFTIASNLDEVFKSKIY